MLTLSDWKPRNALEAPNRRDGIITVADLRPELVTQYATGGDGTEGDPWTGWEVLDWQPDVDFYFPAGFYSLASSPAAWAQSRMRLLGNGSAVLKFTGAGNGLSIVESTGTGYLYDIIVSGLKIIGNAGTTHALNIESVHQSKFEDLLVGNCTTAAVKQTFGVGNVFDRVRHAWAEGFFATQPVNGILFGGRGGVGSSGEVSTACELRGIVVDSVTGAGIYLARTATSSISGFSEQNGGHGIHVTSDCLGLRLFLHSEANSGDDFFIDGGRIDLFGVLGALGGVLRLGANSARCNVFGGSFDDIVITAGGAKNKLWGATFNVSGTGTLTDGGTDTTILGCANVSGAYEVNKLPNGFGNLKLTEATGVGGVGDQDLIIGNTIGAAPAGAVAGSIKVNYNGTDYYLELKNLT